MSVIETADLRKLYREVVAVDSLSLSVQRGEIFGFLGPNGAGKTTTVKMLLGLVHPTAGKARLLDRVPGDPAVMDRVGFLPEHFHFHPWLKAADFLDLHARLHGMPKAVRSRRIPELLARVGLSGRANTRLAQFSKGMTQRIGLAQALLNNPQVVILDEPTSGLDPLGRRQVRNLLRELRQDGVTVFLNSHFLSEVELTCDRVAIISRGRVARQGTIEELTGQDVEVDVRLGGVTPGLYEGLARWGRITWSDALQAAGGNRKRPSPVAGRLPDPVRLTMQVRDETVLPAMAEWLVQNGARLYALSPRRLSLEELFVRIVQEANEGLSGEMGAAVGTTGPRELEWGES